MSSSNHFVVYTLLIGTVLGATEVSAALPNATSRGGTCSPPVTNCFASNMTTASVPAAVRGRVAYTTLEVMTSLTEEDLIAQFQAEFIVAIDVESHHDFRVPAITTATTVRGQSIGF